MLLYAFLLTYIPYRTCYHPTYQSKPPEADTLSSIFLVFLDLPSHAPMLSYILSMYSPSGGFVDSMKKLLNDVGHKVKSDAGDETVYVW